MTDPKFYSRLNTLVEEANRSGLDMDLIIADLRLLARALEAIHVDKSQSLTKPESKGWKMPRKNEWASRFASARRATDRAILAECERAIGLEESAGLHTAKTSQRPPAAVSDDPRAAIARAFGRPVY